MLGVVFHEFCHALWKHKSALSERMIRRAIDEHPLPAAAAMAGGLLDEAIATAFGNGWFRYHQYGEEALKGQWYADEMVSSFGKLVYPLVVEYIEQGRVIDENFVRFALARFVWKHGETVDDPSTIMRSFIAFSDRGSIGAATALRVLSQRFGSTQNLAAEPIGHPRLLRRYRELRWTTVFFIDEPHPSLDDFEPGLAAKSADLLDLHAAFAHLLRASDGRLLMLIHGRTDGEVTELIDRLANLPRFEAGMTVRLD